MESLFIVNPRRKKRKGRMPAGLRRYWASRRRQKNPRKRRRARMMAAPVHHRKRRRNPRRHRSHHRIRRRRANPKYMRRAKRRRHRNPFSTSGMSAMLKPAAIGAAGAIATAIAYGYLSPSLPTTLTTGYIPYVVQAAAALGIGMLVGKFMSRQDGQYATVGALTVVAVSAITPLITSAAPSLPGLSGLGGMGAYQPYRRMGAYAPSLQRSQTSRFGRLGFISPAPKVGMGAYMAAMGRGGAASDLSGSGFNGLNG
jgi:hypothetical protein